MISSIRINKSDDPAEQMANDSLPPGKFALKHVEDHVQIMRNRVDILKKQLQKQKESMRRHRSMVDQTVQQKIELNKISSIKHRDYNAIGQQISSLKARNHSYRQNRKYQMNNILKALYMVKLDDARQIKNMSLENHRSLEKMNQDYNNQLREKRRQLVEQEQQAKQKYQNYWKNKINAVYQSSQKRVQQHNMIAQERRRQLQLLQTEEMNLLQQINQTRTKDSEAKKQYLAALSLKNQEVSNAIQQKQTGRYIKKRKSKKDLNLNRSQLIQSNKLYNTPQLSYMSSSSVVVPKANVNQKKLHTILKQLRSLGRQQQFPQYQ